MVGCPDQLALSKRESHVAVCGYVQLTCGQCSEVLDRKDMQRHQDAECRCIRCGQLADNGAAHFTAAYGCSNHRPCIHECTYAQWSGVHIEKQEFADSIAETLEGTPDLTMPICVVKRQYEEESCADLHDRFCPNKPVTCNICLQQIARSQLRQHVADDMVNHVMQLHHQLGHTHDKQIWQT